MIQNTTFIGLDVHKATIQVALLEPGREKPECWQLSNVPRAVSRLAAKLSQGRGPVQCCYEAGPCGYELQRHLRKKGIDCVIVAPSLIPSRPGDRIKTDRRDAANLARLLRAGLLTEVHPPTPEEEAVKDLSRAREAAKEDVARSRHRLGKFLLRRGVRYTTGKRAWTQAHRRWLIGLRFEAPAAQATFDDYLRAVEFNEERVAELDRQLEAIADSEPYREPVARLKCFRGISTVTAMTIVSELHGFSRFDSPRRLMAYLGLVPSEHSSGASERRGSITKAGNSHVRRVLVESAWHYRHRPAVGVALRKRREGQPGWIIALADRAQRRLNRKMTRMVNAGKPRNKAVIAVARELAGFVWAAMQPVEHSA